VPPLRFLRTSSSVAPSIPRALSNVRYLVIEGFLDTNGPTVIRLSSTTSLGSVDGRVPEQNATVKIEDDRGGTYVLPETESGSYSASALIIDPVRNYRLKIRTASNKEYASDFVWKTGDPYRYLLGASEGVT